MSTKLLLEKLQALLEELPATGEADTAEFKPITHEMYLERLKQWLELHRDWFGELPRISHMHGGDEEGCDSVVAFVRGKAKVCFQFKSYNDFYDYPKGKASDFANKVLSQILKAGNAYQPSAIHVILGADLTSTAQKDKIAALEKLLAKSASILEKAQVEVHLLKPQQALALFRQPDVLINMRATEERRRRDFNIFARALGDTGESLGSNIVFRNIGSLYVRPFEYDDIVATLREHHIVCIVGEPHMGKTYTALYLLLAYYQRGYTPRWEMEIPTPDVLEEKPLLERYHQAEYHGKWDIGKFVEPGQIVYIEDPFGKASEEELHLATSSESRFDLRWLLDAVTKRATVNQSRPPKVIITSRRAVFERVTEAQPALKDLVVEVRKGISYNEQMRREILRKYAELFESKWLEDSTVEQQIIEQAVDGLLAPHNIYLFVNRSKDYTDPESLEQEISKSKEIVPALAADIALLPPLSQLVFVAAYATSFKPSFRSFPRLHPPFWRCYEHYQAFAQTLGYEAEEAADSLRSTVENWSSLLEGIALGRIGTTHQHYAAVRFLHPSVAEATAQYIAQSNHTSIFSQLCLNLKELADNPQHQDSAAKLIHPLVAHFESLPPEVLDQLRSLFGGTEYIDKTIIESLLANYAWLPPALRSFLDELDPNEDEQIWHLFMRAAYPNTSLAFEQTLELWERALGRGAIHGKLLTEGIHPMFGPIARFQRLTDNLQQIILDHLESRNQFRWYSLASSLVRCYKYLPPQLQQWVHVLATEGNRYVIYEILWELSHHYSQLPDDIRSLVEHYGTAPNWECRAYVVQAFWNTRDKLQDDHARLVKQLATQDSDARVRIVAVHTHLALTPLYEDFDLPDPDVTAFNELFYSEDPENAAGTLFALFNTTNSWENSTRAEKYGKRFEELLASKDPLVVAMRVYRISQKDHSLTWARRLIMLAKSSEIRLHKDFVNSLADGLEDIEHAPRGTSRES